MNEFEAIKRRNDIKVNPDAFKKEHEKKLNAYNYKCPFKVGDLVKRRKDAGTFTYPHEELPAKVMRVFDNYELASRSHHMSDMVCAVINDLDDVDVFLFNSLEFEPYLSI